METVTELSAGGVVLRHAVAGGTDVLLIQHSAHKGWGFPKGWIEPGETPEEAALREVQEESGMLGDIIGELPATQYFYTNRERPRVAKTGTWFLMRYVGEGSQTHAHGVSAVEWVPLESVH